MPESLDPDAAERVLRRAGDLAEQNAEQNAEHDAEHGIEDGDDDAFAVGIEPAALISAAAEVGIPERAVRQSLAIERLGPPPAEHRLDSWVGPAAISEQRVVASTPDDVLDLLDRWLVGAHHLRRDRRRPGEIEWSRRDDLVGGLHRKMRGLSGEGRLGHVRRVQASATAIDAESTVLRVVVDRRDQRRVALVGGSTLGGGAVAIGVVGAVLTAPIAFAAIPVGIAGGVVVSSGRSQADRFERELCRLLDAIEEDRVPPGLLSGIRRRFVPRRAR